MKFKHSYLLILLALILVSSCGENSDGLKTETHYFDETNKAWIPDISKNQFIMQDSNGISQSFTRNRNQHEFNKSWSSVFWITTLTTYTEYHFQEYQSSFQNHFNLSLSAGWCPFGDEICITMNGVHFAYDLTLNHVTRVGTNSETISHSQTDEGYSTDEAIYSDVEMLYNYTVNGITYDTVLHFTLRDFTNQQTELTATEIFVAKNIGLVQYTLKNGISFMRK